MSVLIMVVSSDRLVELVKVFSMIGLVSVVMFV